MTDISSPPPKYTPEQLKRRNRKALAIALPVGVVLLGLAVWGASLSASDAEPAGSGEAQQVCEQFVGDRLKAPGTAEFDHANTYREGLVWVVLGTVDSENGFGALLRTSFRCEVEPVSDEWRLVDLSME